ncbi:C39 family peptidase [Mariniplasma anaerobium]|uniref:Peptidase C39-like domain-containing protein n=1 Tax=Mariniplasma anaerobium TaxID=2735436 RepID=A0A7U9TIC4_9MOLU|nr:C39 family peptidase [Mariniplasma anaerobium]BCR35744.1 hypothetical protein MPAN_006370 [Mariniplasma anaerobium]
MRKVLFVLLLFAFIVSINGCLDQDRAYIDNQDSEENIEDPKDEEGEDIMDNTCQASELVSINQTHTLNADELWSHSMVCDNLKLENSMIKLDDNNFQGILETSDFHVESFAELVPTWNVVLDEKSTVTIFVAIGNHTGYSDYYAMALWRKTYKTSLEDQVDQYGRKTIDTITPKLIDINRIKFKVIFAKSDTDATALKNISITTIPKQSENHYDFSILQEKSILLEPRQQLSVPAIGNLICSPTSLSMVLNYYNHSESQSLVSSYVFDQGAQIYGNWSFNASYAGGFDDLYARVQYANDLSTLSSYINNDQPLVLSIRTQTKEELEGSIMAYPSGHLLVLTGFKLIDDTWYALVSDPAEYEDSKVNREYNLQDLLDAWRGYIYVVQTTPF